MIDFLRKNAFPQYGGAKIIKTNLIQSCFFFTLFSLLTISGAFALPNPAAVFCNDLGGKYELSSGDCLFTDDLICDALTLFNERQCGNTNVCTSNADCSQGQFCWKNRCSSKGLCRPKPQVCIQVFDPVCGCDGRTYSNSCVANSNGVNVAYPGECTKEKSVILNLHLYGNTIMAMWSANFKPEKYVLFYAPYPQMDPILSVDLGKITSLEATLQNQSQYFIAIGAKDSKGSYVYSNIEYFRIVDIKALSPGTSWQWQLTGPIDTTIEAKMFDIDLFNVPIETISELHQKGRIVICYFSAGTYENWRPDAYLFPKSLLGNNLEDWPDEKWLDIRKLDTLAPIIKARLDLAVSKGCDGVEPDNVDAYVNDSGFPITYDDQLRYNIWLASEAHKRGLSIGLKNDLEQVKDLEPFFDWALNEECFSHGECELLLPFIEHGKAVFGVEYLLEPEKFCNNANSFGFDFLKKHQDLDAWRIPCGPLKRNCSLGKFCE